MREIDHWKMTDIMCGVKHVIIYLNNQLFPSRAAFPLYQVFMIYKGIILYDWIVCF